MKYYISSKAEHYQKTFNITERSSDNNITNRGVTQSYWTTTIKQLRKLIGTNMKT